MATRCLLLAALTCVITISGRAQRAGFAGGGGGGGPLSPTVVATWDAHFGPLPGQPAADPFSASMMLDLLVLWRGKPGWFDDATLSFGAGGSDGVHQVAAGGHALSLRFDRQTGTVLIQDRTIALQGANVLLLDDVDNESGLLVAGTMRVDPVMSGNRPAQGGRNVHPLAEIIRRSPELFEYLRCDPVFTDPNDPTTTSKLRNCEDLR